MSRGITGGCRGVKEHVQGFQGVKGSEGVNQQGPMLSRGTIKGSQLQMDGHADSIKGSTEVPIDLNHKRFK